MCTPRTPFTKNKCCTKYIPRRLFLCPVSMMTDMPSAEVSVSLWWSVPLWERHSSWLSAACFPLMQAAIVAGRCVVIVFPPRRYSYIRRSSMQRHTGTDTQSSNTHTHTHIHFDTSCLLTDDISGMEIAHIPPTATAQSSPTGSPRDSSLLLSPFLFSFTSALTLFSFSLEPHQLLFHISPEEHSTLTSALRIHKSNCQKVHLSLIKAPGYLLWRWRGFGLRVICRVHLFKTQSIHRKRISYNFYETGVAAVSVHGVFRVSLTKKNKNPSFLRFQHLFKLRLRMSS